MLEEKKILFEMNEKKFNLKKTKAQKLYKTSYNIMRLIVRISKLAAYFHWGIKVCMCVKFALRST